MENKNILSIVAIIMLLLAIPSGIWPYWYYIFLRWVVAGIALFVLSIAYEVKKGKWVWIMGGLALLFNPLTPTHLSKEAWVILDLIAAGLFFVSIFKIRKQ
ncbi:MAG: hypothetical protein PHH35_01730 [Candidatus Pacebacteria bacterium]|jgi:hypothetical protein|nr:hypothetical protein [Candidatus Paceibacterota bacterium]